MISGKKVKLGFYVILGYIYKILIDIHVLRIPRLSKNNCEDIIVSLTSYGRRVETNVVYYTIVSLLRQRVQPSMIILWLADNEWNDNTIPSKLKSLKEKGVTICYCEDIKSYKKLIPTLKKYPDYSIITVDDDAIYSTDTLDALVKEHQRHPTDIVCLHAAKIISEQGIPSRYMTWQDLIKEESGILIFPIGEGGVLYPKGCLHEDVYRSDLFVKLCPMADDIWFWICGLRKGTQKRFINKSGINLSFDILYQFLHKGAALTQNNRFESSNDIQFKKVFDYYKIRLDQTGKINKEWL